ncbi:MAG TPA: VWA domain-containing protein, partial [Phycisphaerae bacterium]|nr:VWA domain-containing protein [Phycisphaerae bacterium]
MNFLAPWHVPVLAAALALPPLVLLYFLKLKRRQIPIASTLLWKRAVHDLQVNSPFQRLRNNLLLILQLLILIAAIAAISEPVRPGKRGIDKAMVLLIDQSASMGAKEADGRTRLQIAKEEAHKIVNELGSSQRAMIIAFCDRARVMSAFTNDKPQLRAAIDAIEQTDGPSLLREAMELAEAHSTPIGEVREVGSSQYILLTDGRLPDSESVRVERGTMEIARIGEATENVGIVSLDVRRNYDRPEQISALINVRNFGTRPAKRDISLLVDGQIKNVQDLPELAPYGRPDAIHAAKYTKDPADNSQATAAFEMMLDTAATIEVRLSGEDALAIDDRAFAVVTPPRSIKALLVSPGNRFLRIAIGAVLDSFDIWQPEEYEKASDDKLI